jgi:hypothetical protein
VNKDAEEKSKAQKKWGVPRKEEQSFAYKELALNFGMHQTPPDRATINAQRKYVLCPDEIVLAFDLECRQSCSSHR